MSGTDLPTRRLDFTTVDDLSSAVALGVLDLGNPRFSLLPEHLGPALEWRHCLEVAKFPSFKSNPWMAEGSLSAMIDALDSGRALWISPRGGLNGFVRTHWNPLAEDTTWMGFSLMMRKAASVAGFSATTARQFDAAITELWNNAFEHSEAWDTGLVAFHASPRSFEFVVADSGIGILESLRTAPEFASLRGHGEALMAALTDGASRHGGGQARGHGFRQLFVRLRSMDVGLRFRTGDHVLTFDGQNPTLTDAVLREKAPLKGFSVSAVCRPAGACRVTGNG